MKTYSTRAQLKALSRQQLLGKYLTFFGAYMTLFMLRYIITVPSFVASIPGIGGMIAYYAADFVITLFFSIFHAGLAYMFLSNACRHRIASSNVFIGFSLGLPKVIFVWFLPALLSLIAIIIPDLILSRIMEYKGDKLITYIALWLLIVLPLSWLLQTIIRIPFCLVYYLLLDFPNLEPAECCRRSIQLMRGHKWRYFKIMLSFIPFYILGILSFGIGFLYVLPYKEQTCAYFYLDLMKENAA